jgi:hypothetical protein
LRGVPEECNGGFMMEMELKVRTKITQRQW